MEPDFSMLDASCQPFFQELAAWANTLREQSELSPRTAAFLLFNRIPAMMSTDDEVIINLNGKWRAYPKTLRKVLSCFLSDADDVETAYEIYRQIVTNNPWYTHIPEIVRFPNGVFNLETGEFSPREWEFPGDQLPWDYIPQAQCPQWLEALRQWFGSARNIQVIQEFIGSCLMVYESPAKILYCYGTSWHVKHQLRWVLDILLGTERIVSVPPEKWSSGRAIEFMQGRQLNLTDVSDFKPTLFQHAFHQVMTRGRFWSPLPPFKGYVLDTAKVNCQHLFMATDLPKIPAGSARDILHYLLPIPILPAEPSLNFPNYLRCEMPGIMAWAMEGAKRLVANNMQFTQPEGWEELCAMYQESDNPVAVFITQHCTPAEGQVIPMAEFRERFHQWHGSHLTPTAIAHMVTRGGYRIAQKRFEKEILRCLMGYQWQTAGQDKGSEENGDCTTSSDTCTTSETQSGTAKNAA